MKSYFCVRLEALTDLTFVEVDQLDAAIARGRRFSPSSNLIHDGDPVGPLLVMLGGWAIRYKISAGGGRQILAIVMPGDVCNLHGGSIGQANYGIQTISEALVASIPREEVDQLMLNYEGIADGMRAAQVVEENTSDAWLVRIGRRTALQRVAELFCELYYRANTIGLIKTESIRFPLSQIAISDALGLTPVHTNRMYKILQELGAISVRNGKPVVTDISKLIRIAEYDRSYLQMNSSLSTTTHELVSLSFRGRGMDGIADRT